MKYTQSTLDKVEKILDESGYMVRYERGNFQSGYCILEEKKVVVLNKFLQTEGRINTLIDIIPQLNLNTVFFTPETKKVFDEVISKFEEGNSYNRYQSQPYFNSTTGLQWNETNY